MEREKERGGERIVGMHCASKHFINLYKEHFKMYVFLARDCRMWL